MLTHDERISELKLRYNGKHCDKCSQQYRVKKLNFSLKLILTLLSMLIFTWCEMPNVKRKYLEDFIKVKL